jgi:hypothetical protein
MTAEGSREPSLAIGCTEMAVKTTHATSVVLMSHALRAHSSPAGLYRSVGWRTK